MSFQVTADAYDRFMGRYSLPLATEFADFAGVRSGNRALDVGCGPGSLTGELVRRLGIEAVSAVDPSAPFLTALRNRFPRIDAFSASAEDLPFDEGTFDMTIAQLVVHFMSDPVAGLEEMKRVTRVGGVVAACVWDHGGHRGPLDLFWRTARRLDPQMPDESELPGTREGHLVELFQSAGLVGVEGELLTVVVEHPTFDEWWEPYTLGVGPAGAYVSQLNTSQRTGLESACRALLAQAPFQVSAGAWAVRGLRDR